MLEKFVGRMQAAAGIENVVDFGIVHSGQIGAHSCEVKAGIERWRGRFYVRIATVHKSRGFRRTRVVKWAYSAGSPFGLSAAIGDLDTVSRGPSPVFVDRRSRFWRFVDRMIGHRSRGTYRFLSPLPSDDGFHVTAELVEVGGQDQVTLTERTPGRGFIFAHLPRAAFAAVSAVLRDYSKKD